MQNDLSSLVTLLRAARDFEAAVGHTLRRMLEVAEAAVASSTYAGSARVLRGMVHLRPGDGYRRLAFLEAGAALARQPGAQEVEVGTALLASATAWRSLVRYRCAVSIDVHLGAVEPHASGAEPTGEQAFRNQESRQRFLGRQASHVCVLPLRVPGGDVDGMISLEADCLAAVGREFVWRQCEAPLQLIADVAAPFLMALPVRPVAEQQVDELLPVVGASMAELLPLLRVFAKQEETLLISGATGAGKSRLARWCHERSVRSGGPFEALDLVTVPEDLQMAELFGWRKGAFTGAVRDNAGSVARAEAGTLFIDEIDKLSLKAQAGLLHLLEERTYRALGEGAGERRANVRFVIGTNSDLLGAVREGRFREDLYYRINVLTVRLPPLDERRDEIPLWARYMVERRHHERFPEGHAHLTADAEQLLATSPWPGNLRQLDNIVRRAYTLAMVNREGDSGEVVLEERHVARALAYEGPPGARSLVESMRLAALAFVSEARRRDSSFDLDLADAFRGFVLGTAVRQLGRDEAFRIFGRERLVRNRNHYKALRREVEKVDALLRVLGEKGSPFNDLLALDEAEAKS